MIAKFLTSLVAAGIAILPCASCGSPQLLPAPKLVQQGKGTYALPLRIQADATFASQAAALAGALEKITGQSCVVAVGKSDQEAINLLLAKNLPDEGYQIDTRTGIMLQAATPTGMAHATATVLQLVERDENAVRQWQLPCVFIKDTPDFPFRSFLVDMGRNPHSPEMLRHVVDMMWFYKANYLHLHLTDDQLISWPSKAFPKLYSERAGWTWENFEALEEYSQARGVTVIPELEVPGHSGILRGKYPEVFGKTPTDLATRPEARQGIETLIDEMLSVFRATPYMHIGGDEAYGVPHDLQRELINQLNAHVKKRGRRTVVWEGPPPGEGANKVAEDVVHLCWRSLEFPAQQMLEAGYEIVNAPWDPLYIVDHYPRTMFTAVDVERCYNWNPRRFAHINHAFPTFKNPHMTKTTEGILGFCMPWWEGREENLLPICLPRLAAVSSAAWNREGERDFAGYRERYEMAQPGLEKVSGFALPAMPFADPETQKGNLAYRAKVTPSDGASQPHFGPARLTNGIPDRFDHFLGFPTQPDPLEILIELVAPAKVGRIVVYERAVGKSHEIYEVLVSADGSHFEKVGASGEGTRGEENHVAHRFTPREIRFIKIVTQGCHGLTFPSFSRLSEVMAFAE